MLDVDWLRGRFWTWIHYAVEKAERGELHDCIEALAFIRGTVLGPLALTAAGGALRLIELDR